MTGPIWFSEAEITELLDPAALVDRIEEALIAYHRGTLVEPRPTRIPDTALETNFVAFPAYWPEGGYAACKVLSGARRNPARGLPMIDAIIALTEAETGKIVALMDGRRITALRTAATTAVALRHLRPPAGARLGIIGTGAQAVAHAEALTAVLDIGTITIASASSDGTRVTNAAARIATCTGHNTGTATPADTATTSDILVLTTLSPAPVIAAPLLLPDAIVACVGPFRPGATELDPAALTTARYAISDLAQRFNEDWTAAPFATEIADLSAVLAERTAAPSSGRRIFFSDGRGLEDLVAAKLVLQSAARLGRAGLLLP